MDLNRGQWAMSFEGVLAYMPMMHKIMMGDSVPISSQALLEVINGAGSSGMRCVKVGSYY
jgi:hypothetical protein